MCLDPTMHATPAKVVGAFHSTQKLRFDLRASSLSAVRDGLLPPGYTEKERFSWVHDSSSETSLSTRPKTPCARPSARAAGRSRTCTCPLTARRAARAGSPSPRWRTTPKPRPRSRNWTARNSTDARSRSTKPNRVPPARAVAAAVVAVETAAAVAAAVAVATGAPELRRRNRLDTILEAAGSSSRPLSRFTQGAEGRSRNRRGGPLSGARGGAPAPAAAGLAIRAPTRYTAPDACRSGGRSPKTQKLRFDLRAPSLSEVLDG